MPRKAGYRHIDETRAKIQATQLINRLHKHVMAEKPVLDASQVNAAKALLAKVLPDLAAVQHSGQVETTYIARMPEPVDDIAEWQKRYSPSRPTMQ